MRPCGASVQAIVVSIASPFPLSFGGCPERGFSPSAWRSPNRQYFSRVTATIRRQIPSVLAISLSLLHPYLTSRLP